MSTNKIFSHIYIEQEAINYPDTELILSKFKNAQIIEINNYKEIFNTPRQNWRIQKKSQKLILAVKKAGFLYKGTSVAQNFKYENFYYNSLILNCLYDCDYCYLQGLYPSANAVIFVNNQLFQDTVEEKLKTEIPLYLCISYDTDLLAFEGTIPFCSRWIEFARKQKDLIIEIRTKSANFNTIQNIKPTDNVILAWTISPSSITQEYEKLTPSLDARIKSINAALKKGWKVRLCFDPILSVKNWESVYSEFLDRVKRDINLNLVSDISLGTFRIAKDQLKRIKKERIDSSILYDNFIENNGIYQYTTEQKEKMENFVISKLHSFGIQAQQIERVEI